VLKCCGSRQSAASESGSVLIAVIVIFVATVAMAATLTAVTNTLASTRNDQNRVTAFQFANAGIDQSVFRIDEGQLPVIASGNYTPTLTAGVLTGFTDKAVAGGSNVNITATYSATNEWTVTATGVDASGTKRRVVASVQDGPIFVNAFFAIQSFSLTGNQTTPIAYSSSTCLNLVTFINPDGTSCELPTPIPSTLGTNGTLGGSGVSHFAQYWAGFTMFGRATQAAAQAACSGCPAPQVFFNTNTLVNYVPPVPIGALACPTVLTSGSGGVMTPGDYSCSVVNLGGTLTVGTGGNGTGTVRIWVAAAGTFGGSGTVNQYKPTKNFQVFMPALADGSSEPGSICDSVIWGLLDTPSLSIGCTGSHQPEIYGAVVSHDYAGAGNHFGFHWDEDSIGGVGNGLFAIRNWRECPPATTTIC
jgi:hypothetical protein